MLFCSVSSLSTGLHSSRCTFRGRFHLNIHTVQWGDPASVAAGITGLSTLVSDLASHVHSTYKYGSSVKKAPQAIREAQSTLESLRKLLSDLQQLYTNRTEDLPHVEGIQDEIRKCRADLDDFWATLKPKSHRWGRVLHRLLWPLKEADVKEFIRKLEAHQQRFEAAKSSDQLVLASEIMNIARQGTDHLQDREFERIARSLSSLDFGKTQFDLYHKRRQQQTSVWILNDPQYVRWRDYLPSSSSALWCTGDPGAGKSVTW